MELPIEIWQKILENTTDKNTCQNLYNSFAQNTRNELKNIFSEKIMQFEQYVGILTTKSVFIYNDEKISELDGDYINIKFRFKTNEIIILKRDGKIILYNYLTKNIVSTAELPLLESYHIVRTNMDITLDGNTLIICRLSYEFNLYVYEITQDEIKLVKRTENSFYFDIFGYPKIIINPTKSEIAILIYGHYNWGDIRFLLNIFDYKTNELKYSTDKKINLIKYSENGDLYIGISKKGIYKIENNNLIKIIKIKHFIFDFIVNKNNIYFSISNTDRYGSEIYSYDINSKKNRIIHFQQSTSIYNLKLKNNKLWLQKMNGIYTINIESIKSLLNYECICNDEKYLDLEDIIDYDL